MGLSIKEEVGVGVMHWPTHLHTLVAHASIRDYISTLFPAADKRPGGDVGYLRLPWKFVAHAEDRLINSKTLLSQHYIACSLIG